MPISNKRSELSRLIAAFEAEAQKFHPTTFTLEYLAPPVYEFSRAIEPQKHHGIFLWQFYGTLGGEQENSRLAEAATAGPLTWGLPGAELTCIGIIEGESFDLFVRMATRAGALFDEAETSDIKLRVANELVEAALAKSPGRKVVTSTNSNPLAVWLNYLLYHLSQTNPGRERSRRIDPDPFTLSLLALERLASTSTVSKMESGIRRLADLQFRVALSFSGDNRTLVATVVERLQAHLGRDAVFYDYDFKAQLARPNMDLLLQNVYRHQSDLLVVFLSEQYAERDWCGLEWRAVRDLIKSRKSEQIMLVRLDSSPMEGLLSIDGYLDASNLNPSELADLILERVTS
jgi:TIR domain